MTVSVDIYTTFDQELGQIWRQLESESNCYIFQGYDWNLLWFNCIGSNLPQARLCIVVVRYRGTPVILFPFFLHRRYRITYLQFLGGDQSDYLTPLFCPDVIQTLDLVYIWKRVSALLPRHDLLILEKLPHVILGITNPFLELWPSNVSSQAHAASLPLDWDTLQSRTSSKLRSDSRRQVRRLSQYGDITFNVAKDFDDYKKMITTLFYQKSARYQSTGARDLLANINVKYFYLSAFHSLGDAYSVHMSTLCSAGETVATHWGASYNNRFYWLMPSFSLGPASAFSPGRILLEFVMKSCIDDGYSTFDFTLGSEPYKLAWCDQLTLLSDYSLSRSSLGLLVLRIRALFTLIKRNSHSRQILMKVVSTCRHFNVNLMRTR